MVFSDGFIPIRGAKRFSKGTRGYSAVAPAGSSAVQKRVGGPVGSPVGSQLEARLEEKGLLKSSSAQDPANGGSSVHVQDSCE